MKTSQINKTAKSTYIHFEPIVNFFTTKLTDSLVRFILVVFSFTDKLQGYQIVHTEPVFVFFWNTKHLNRQYLENPFNFVTSQTTTLVNLL